MFRIMAKWYTGVAVKKERKTYCNDEIVSYFLASVSASIIADVEGNFWGTQSREQELNESLSGCQSMVVVQIINNYNVPSDVFNPLNLLM